MIVMSVMVYTVGFTGLGSVCDRSEWPIIPIYRVDLMNMTRL